MKTTFIIIALAIAVLFQLKLSAQTNISNNNINDYSPFTNGSSIIWLETLSNGNPRELVLYDTATQVKTNLTNYGLTLMDLQYNGNQVIWNVYENDNFEIYDISLNTLTVIDNLVYWDYHLGNNHVVYNRSNEDTMRVYNITTETNTKIISKQGYAKDIDNNLLLFRGIDWNLYLYNLTDNTLTPITSGGNNQVGDFAHISGNTVVWGGINSNKNIWTYNISTGVTTPIVSTNDVNDIAIYGDFIVYKTSSSAPLKKYKISTGVISDITPVNGNYSMPVVSDSLLVYSEGTTGGNTLIVKNINTNMVLLSFFSLPCFILEKI